MGDENKIRDAADAIAGVAKAVPVYQDVVQPAAKEVGTALQTLAKTVHIALAPVSALVWGYEQLKDFVSTRVTERLKDVPPENIIPPKPNVAGPALEALRYTGHEESLSEMYANLLAAAMTKDTAAGAHPSFVEIIKQLTSDEAKLLKYMSSAPILPMISVSRTIAGQEGQVTILSNYSHLGLHAQCEYPEMTPTYIDNLSRLGITHVPEFGHYTDANHYQALENHPEILQLKAKIESNAGVSVTIQKKFVAITELGKQFSRICIVGPVS